MISSSRQRIISWNAISQHAMEIDMNNAEWFQDRLRDWGKENIQSFPWRACDSPVHQLLAEILLQRTRAEQVVGPFMVFAERYRTLEDLASLSTQAIEDIIYSLGLHWRARKIHDLVLVLERNLAGEVPKDLDALVNLPGVGTYAASAFLSLHQGIRMPIVDSNVVRVYGRFFGFDYDGETRRKAWLIDLAEKLTPRDAFKEYNYALIDFARNRCAALPKCEDCPMASRCQFVIGTEETGQ